MFTQLQNHLMTHFSECIPVVKRCMTTYKTHSLSLNSQHPSTSYKLPTELSHRFQTLKVQNCTVNSISSLSPRLNLFFFSISHLKKWHHAIPHPSHKSVGHHLQCLFLYLYIQCGSKSTFLIFSSMQLNI